MIWWINSRKGKCIRAKEGKQTKTRKGEGKEEILSPFVFNGSCTSRNVMAEKSKRHNENLRRHVDLALGICADLVYTHERYKISIIDFAPFCVWDEVGVRKLASTLNSVVPILIFERFILHFRHDTSISSCTCIYILFVHSFAMVTKRTLYFLIDDYVWRCVVSDVFDQFFNLINFFYSSVYNATTLFIRSYTFTTMFLPQ
jgi:hypothetical protein